MRMDSVIPSSVVKERILSLYYREQPWWSRWLCRPAIGIVNIVRVCQHFRLIIMIDLASLDLRTTLLCPNLTETHLVHR